MLFQKISNWLKSVFNPPYQLTLCGKIAGKNLNERIYVLKQYGSHEYFKVNYSDITNNKGLCAAIKPSDLVEIVKNECIAEQLAGQYHIVEWLRNNHYTISNGPVSASFSGDYICKNIDMFSHLVSSDLYKIVYQTGFQNGRRISKEISASLQKQHKKSALKQEMKGDVIEFSDYFNKETV